MRPVHLRELAVAAGLVTLAVACSSSSAAVETKPPTTPGAPGSSTTGAPVASTSPVTTAAPRRPTTTLPTVSAPTTLPGITLPPPPAELPVPAPVPPAGASEPEFIVGTIEIPKIGLSKYLFAGITDRTLDKGPGYWPGTALPGHVGNTVVAGHRTSKDRPFRDLDDLVPGDEIIYVTAEGRFVYRVTETQIVSPNALWITTQTTARTTTLFACHPPGSTRQRIVVFAELVA